MPKHVVKILTPIANECYDIFVDKGANLILNMAKPPMIKAVREHYLESPDNMEITPEGACFLFTFDGIDIDPNDKYYAL